MYPNFKTQPFNHQLQALGCSPGTKLILLTSWKWEQVNPKS
jgi:hypothetical protein